MTLPSSIGGSVDGDRKPEPALKERKYNIICKSPSGHLLSYARPNFIKLSSCPILVVYRRPPSPDVDFINMGPTWRGISSMPLCPPGDITVHDVHLLGVYEIC